MGCDGSPQVMKFSFMSASNVPTNFKALTYNHTIESRKKEKKKENAFVWTCGPQPLGTPHETKFLILNPKNRKDRHIVKCIKLLMSMSS